MSLSHTSTKKVLVIAGPTGSGESTITNKLIEQFPKSFRRLVTATTRAPRGGEKNGIDYYFFSKEEFHDRKIQGDMLETTYVTNRDIHYGTFAPDLAEKLEAGFIVIVNPDIVGARFYKEHYNATTIFIAPRDLETLSNRLKSRNPDIPPEELASRLENAKNEMENERSFYDHAVINEDGKLDEAVAEVTSMLRSEGYVF